jgi:hypothetical protein
MTFFKLDLSVLEWRDKSIGIPSCLISEQRDTIVIQFDGTRSIMNSKQFTKFLVDNTNMLSYIAETGPIPSKVVHLFKDTESH